MEDKYSEEQLLKAQQKAEGRDKIGVLGEVLTTGVGTAGGVVASTTIASVAGATTTTFMGSSFLGGVLGVGIVATPAGWVVGSAVAGTVLTYSLIKMVRSGERNDQIREQLVTDIIKKRKEELLRKRKESQIHHLEELLEECILLGKISREKSDQLISLVKENKLNVIVARVRIKNLLKS